MNIFDFMELTKKLTYRGNKCFELSRVDHYTKKKVPRGYIMATVFIRAKDVLDGSNTSIGMSTLMSIKEIESTSIDLHLTWLRDQLQLLELHEVNETFQLDGKRIFDPHSIGLKRFTNDQLKVA